MLIVKIASLAQLQEVKQLDMVFENNPPCKERKRLLMQKPEDQKIDVSKQRKLPQLSDQGGAMTESLLCWPDCLPQNQNRKKRAQLLFTTYSQLFTTCCLGSPLLFLLPLMTPHQILCLAGLPGRGRVENQQKEKQSIFNTS
jgi:hypothetical protein